MSGQSLAWCPAPALTASSAPPHHRQPSPCHTRTWESSKTSPRNQSARRKVTGSWDAIRTEGESFYRALLPCCSDVRRQRKTKRSHMKRGCFTAAYGVIPPLDSLLTPVMTTVGGSLSWLLLMHREMPFASTRARVCVSVSHRHYFCIHVCRNLKVPGDGSGADYSHT